MLKTLTLAASLLAAGLALTSAPASAAAFAPGAVDHAATVDPVQYRDRYDRGRRRGGAGGIVRDILGVGRGRDRGYRGRGGYGRGYGDRGRGGYGRGRDRY